MAPRLNWAVASPGLGSQPVPAHSFGIVLEDTPPVVVHEPEGELGTGVALLGGLAIPRCRFGIVLRYALTEVVHDTEVVLGRSVACSA